MSRVFILSLNLLLYANYFLYTLNCLPNFYSKVNRLSGFFPPSHKRSTNVHITLGQEQICVCLHILLNRVLSKVGICSYNFNFHRNNFIHFLLYIKRCHYILKREYKLKKSFELGILAHACKPSQAETGDCCELYASLGTIASSRLA